MGIKIVEQIGPSDVPLRASAHRVRTRDGVLLATDVYLPAGATGEQPAPVVFVRTPYDKTSRYTAIPAEAEYFTSRGYAYVAQDVRGKFRSTGETVPYAHDVNDAYDSVDWISRQPWCSGAVGLVGASYYGFTVWAGVACGHPAIKAAIPQVTGIDMGDQHVGSRWSQQVPTLAATNDLLQIWTDNDGYLAEIDWNADSPSRVIARWHELVGTSRAAQELLARSEVQSWYNPYGDRHPWHTTTIPVLHWQNWYDPGLAPAGLSDWRHFRGLPSARHLHYLRVGSADHEGFRLDDVGHGDAADPSSSDEALARKIREECAEMADFFDEHLRAIAPETPRARARWHVGHEGWRESDEYPPASEPRVYHLTQSGSLDDRPSAVPGSRSWTHDPDNPVPSGTDMEGLWYLLAAYPDERGLADRADVLTFRTPPLEEGLAFAGRPVLDVELRFDSPSVHLFAKLQDVYPDGTTRPISWGRCVLNDRGGAPVRLDLDDNAYLMRAGHRLQLQLSSSDYPYFVVHPGTDENPWTATERRRVRTTVFLGGIHSATLTMPVIPAASSIAR